MYIQGQKQPVQCTYKARNNLYNVRIHGKNTLLYNVKYTYAAKTTSTIYIVQCKYAAKTPCAIYIVQCT